MRWLGPGRSSWVSLESRALPPKEVLTDRTEIDFTQEWACRQWTVNEGARTGMSGDIARDNLEIDNCLHGAVGRCLGHYNTFDGACLCDSLLHRFTALPSTQSGSAWREVISTKLRGFDTL